MAINIVKDRYKNFPFWLISRLAITSLYKKLQCTIWLSIDTSFRSDGFVIDFLKN